MQKTFRFPAEAFACPRCHAGLAEAGGGLECAACGESYPIVDGVPYLVFYSDDWAEKLRELVICRDFYQKIKNRRLERDRFAGKAREAKTTFENAREFFYVACRQIDFRESPRICDVGAGCGEVAYRLAEMGAQVCAVDLNLFDLHHDLRFLTFAELGDFDYYRILNGTPISEPNFTRVIADGDHLPFGDGYFDYVTMRATAHHVDDLKRFFSEANRVLRPGGRIVLIAEPLASIVDRESEYLREDVDWQEGVNERRPVWREYHRALSASGFTNISVECFNESYGYRVTRRLHRLGLPLPPGRFTRGRITGWRLPLLNFIAAGINVYADKVAKDCGMGVLSANRYGQEAQGAGEDWQQAQDAEEDGQEAGAMASFACVLSRMQQSADEARAMLRESMPRADICAEYDFSAPISRRAIRGAREPEVIFGKGGCYLLSEFFCYLDAGSGAAGICIEHNLQQLAGQERLPIRVFVNDVPVPMDLDYGGWRAAEIPLARPAFGIVELRVSQPELTQRAFEPGAAGQRDVGMAVSRIWLVR